LYYYKIGFKNNSFFTLGIVNTLTSNVRLLTMENGLSGSIAGSTILTTDYHKTAYKRPDGVTN
jgi:hypothetical protein